MTLTAFGIEPEAPAGTVVMWADPLAEIPSGWVLCDGNNGTQNLLGRFPQHTTDEAQIGNTGGVATNSLSTANLPSHNHGQSSVDETGSHTHIFDAGPAGQTGDDDRGLGGGSYPRTTYSGEHSHSINSVGSTGGGSSIDNIPAYYEVAFIQKL